MTLDLEAGHLAERVVDRLVVVGLQVFLADDRDGGPDLRAGLCEFRRRDDHRVDLLRLRGCVLRPSGTRERDERRQCCYDEDSLHASLLLREGPKHAPDGSPDSWIVAIVPTFPSARRGQWVPGLRNGSALPTHSGATVPDSRSRRSPASLDSGLVHT